MKKIVCFWLLTFSHLALAEGEWHALLNKSLSDWDTYISFKHKISYDGSAPKDEKGTLILPIGLNTGNSELNVFTTLEEEGQTVLRVSGEYYGAVTSKQEYQNYHLKLKVRWGDKKWEPRINKLKDGGILYHAVGEHGKEHFRSWMVSQEFQIMQGHMGDYWKQATTAIDVRAYLPEYIMNPVADESQPFIAVGEGEKVEGFVLRKENHERPHGQWNQLELITFNGKSLHIVNGHVVMVLQNSRNVLEHGTEPLIKGKLQLQSEAAEVFYKDILIREIGSLPEQYRRFFQ
jgi:hypothetical protein